RRNDEDVRRTADHGDRREVFDGVVRQLAHRGVGAVRAHVAHHQRVAVGRRTRGRLRTYDATATALVFDDDRLPDRLRQPLADLAGDQVDSAARLDRGD